MDTLLFLKNFITDKNVAAVTPTSTHAVKNICSRMDVENADVIVEYGPGSGVFSEHLLDTMRSDSKLILIERNKSFKKLLDRRVHDPRVYIVNDTAERVLDVLKDCGEVRADYILSGIPFSLMTHETKHNILKSTHEALKSGGKFIPYQTFYQFNNHLKTHMETYFHTVTSSFELMTIPPVRIYEAIK